MAAEKTKLLGNGRHVEPGGSGNLRPNTKIAVRAHREGARA
jgi:hypothetical protein